MSDGKSAAREPDEKLIARAWRDPVCGPTLPRPRR